MEKEKEKAGAKAVPEKENKSVVPAAAEAEAVEAQGAEETLSAEDKKRYVAEGCKEVWRVGGYWFVRKDYAERYARVSGERLKAVSCE